MGSALSAKSISSVSKRVAKDYPDMANVTPKVSPSSSGNFILTYEKKTETSDGESIKLVLKATVDEKGNVLRLSSAR